MGKAKRFNAYDQGVSESRRLVQSYGAQRQRLSINSSFRGMPLEPPTASGLLGTGSGDGKFASASLSADHANASANEHVEFDQLDEDGGIILQTGAGQLDGIFELQGGHKYYLEAVVRPEFGGNTGVCVMSWYDITNAAGIGRQAIYEAHSLASDNADQPVAAATITPAANITVELRVISETVLDAFATEYSHANLFEIALGGSGSGGGGGGSTGVTFPITPTINDHGNVGGGTTDLDLSATTGHVHKLTLTDDETLTFSNPPSSGTQMEFEIEVFQDATGGRTLTFPATVVQTVTISSAPSTKTILTCRTNDGGTTFDVIPSLRGSISLGGGSTFATTALDNLISPILNTDINWNTFDISNMDRIQFAISSGAVAAASTPTLYLNSTGDMTANVATGDSHIKTINNVEEYKMTASALEMNTNQITGTGAILPDAADTYDIGSDSLYWDAIKGRKIEFFGSLSEPNSSSSTGIRITSQGMSLNADGASSIYKFFIEGDTKLTLSSSTLNLNSKLGLTNVEGVTLSDFATDPITNGEFRRNGTDVKVFSGGTVIDFSSIATFPTSDANSIVEGSGDPSKELRFEVDGLTTSTIRVWTVQDANITVAGLDTAQTFTSAQSFDDIAKLAMNSDITFPTANLDIGTASNYPDGVFSERFVLPADTGSLLTSQATLRRVSNLAGSTTGLQINVPTNEDFAITENGATSPLALHIDMSAGIMFLDNPIFTLKLGFDGSSAIEFTKVTGQAADIGCADGIDFLGDIIFEDDVTIGSSGSDTFKVAGGITMKSTNSTEIGFQVTNDSITIGTSGTLQIPVDTGNVGSAAAADTDFGGKVGCMGMYLEGGLPATPTLVIKIAESPNTWAVMILGSTGDVGADRLT